MPYEQANGDNRSSSVAQRTNDGGLGSPGEVSVFPEPRNLIAPCRRHYAVQNAFDNPWIAATRPAAEPVAPPGIVLQIENGADRNNANTERVLAALTTGGMILAVHGFLA